MSGANASPTGRSHQEMKERPINNDRFNNFDDPQVSLKSGGRTFTRILQDIMDHVTEIIRSEVRLAKAEVREDVKQLTNSTMFLVIGGILALYALGFILLGVVAALETRLAPWLSAMLVGVGLAVIAAILVQIGRTKLKQASLKPDKTIHSLQENVTWIKKRTG